MKKIFLTLLLFLCTQIANANSFPTVTEINPAIKALMEKVNIDSLEAKIRYLQDLGSRPRNVSSPFHPNNIAAKNWLYQQYENIGNLDVYFNHFLPDSLCEPFWVPNTFLSVNDAMNVVAVQKGTVYPDEYIIVCSHFDTFFNTPGADDNASGTSGVLEIARVLSPYSFKRSIIYLNNNGEEMGPAGSKIFAYYCRENNINILCVFNLDMIGYNPIGKPLEMFYNERPSINKEFAEYFSEVSDLYLPEIPALPNQNEDTNIYKQGLGDCVMFIHYDYPAMYMGDIMGLKNISDWKYYVPCYHQPCDTIGIGKADAGVNSMELVRAYTRATLAAIAELAELDDSNIENENFINCVIAPNPTNSTATVTMYLKDVGNLTVTLNNLLGQELLEIHNGFITTVEFTKTFSLESLAKGMYYLKIIHNGNTKIEKVIKN